eukprot:285802_1
MTTCGVSDTEGHECIVCFYTRDQDACRTVTSNGYKCRMTNEPDKDPNSGACTGGNYRHRCRCGHGAKVGWHATDNAGSVGIMATGFSMSGGGIYGRAIYLADSKASAKKKSAAYSPRKVITKVIKCSIDGVPWVIAAHDHNNEKNADYWKDFLNKKSADYLIVVDTTSAYARPDEGGKEYIAYNKELIGGYSSEAAHTNPYIHYTSNDYHTFSAPNIASSLILLNILVLFLICFVCALVIGCFTGYSLSRMIHKFKKRKSK